MFIAIVEIPRKDPLGRKDAIKGALSSAPIYRELGAKGLIRKYYLSADEAGGGVYLWESREAAAAWFNEDWWGWMEERFGVRPTLAFFDNFVTVDNQAGEVRVNGAEEAIAER